MVNFAVRATDVLDREVMDAALRLAARTLGDTWPNPAVGCILVQGNRIVGRGWTQSGGRPHAETEALRRAGAAARGATAYVTLEPCSHHGKTPPCAEALIAAGIARVIVATGDPDPRVDGRGVSQLREASVIVDVGVAGDAAAQQNAGFFLRVREGRPLFLLKAATTLDGRIALASGQSRWITGPAARQAAQTLRARYDAVLVGSETAVVDDPQLTCRLEGYQGRPKVRIVLDRRLRLGPTVHLAATAKEIPTWLVTAETALETPSAKALEALGVTLIGVPLATDDTGFAREVARMLGRRGLTRVMIEGGGRVAGAFLRAGLVDEAAWFRASGVLGADARPAVGALDIADLSTIPRFRLRESLSFGEDRLDILSR